MKGLLFFLLFGMPDWIAGNPCPTIGAIPLPAGYHRVNEVAGSFGAWLRAITLKKALTAYLYNGLPKANQEAQFAVLDVSVGGKTGDGPHSTLGFVETSEYEFKINELRKWAN